MTAVWAQAALWLGLALLATLISIWLRIATALSLIGNAFFLPHYLLPQSTSLAEGPTLIGQSLDEGKST